MCFQALVVDQIDQQAVAGIRSLTMAQLPAGEVRVRVEYSSLNYKDALAITGKGKILRSFPMTPGIDFAGAVVESASAAFQPGDPVILTGWGVGERHPGGLAEFASVKAAWLVARPEGLTAAQCMAVGTAGLTAMLCVLALERHGVRPASGEVLVTGATGGVGSVAVAILAKLGYRVVAATGKVAEQSGFLHALGAARVIDRAELTLPTKPLESEAYAAAIDTVGAAVLAGLLPRIQYRGCVAACGLAGGFQLNTTVMPFILRGVTLAGIDSVQCPLPERVEAWARIVSDLPLDRLATLTRQIRLEQVVAECERMTEGHSHGRVVVQLS